MKKFRRFSNILTISIVCLSAVLLGFFVGQTINSRYFSSSALDNIDPQTLKDDINLIKYEGKLPSELTPTECFLVSFKMLSEQPYYKRTSKGLIQTSVGVEQIADNITIKNGDLYNQEYFTYSSMIKSAGKASYRQNEDITVIEGKVDSASFDEISWTDKTKTYSFDEYSELLGRSPSDESIFIVSSKTIIKEELVSKEDNSYTFMLELNPELSAILYRNEISFRTGIEKNSISFSAVKIKFVIDKNFKLLYQEINEEYTMKYSGINVIAYTDFKINFEY